MKESQNIEWKESWRDEFGKWICGFANAVGGKLFIGLNDKGIVAGVTDAKKLMEDIPNKMPIEAIPNKMCDIILGNIVDIDLSTNAFKSFRNKLPKQNDWNNRYYKKVMLN